ncbi:MAG: penicillin-insensitive murein endopeptidase [Bdellovibrionaceae bacterium]|nr:penicillin-insensitive murein endopeptidase [Pseudobdellovibrionaceae bacterium]
MKPLSLVKLFISLIAIFYVVACGRSFKTLDAETVKALETPPLPPPANNASTETSGGKAENAAAISELWVQEIPEKYDDVGDFFRVKEIPGLYQEQVLDSVDIGGDKSGKKLNLVRGKLKLSRVTHHFDSVSNQLEVSGDVVFDDGKPLAFKMAGPMHSGEISLRISDPMPGLKDVFRAKAMCSSSVSIEGIENTNSSVDFCRRVIIDFYYRHKDTFYTDQLITKDILFDEIKKIELPAASGGDSLTDEDLESDLSDYEKSQKYGTLEAPTESISEGELPYYFVDPSIDDVASLYPDVSKEIEAKKQLFFKNKKKLKAIPKLTGDEHIPEKDVDVRIVAPPVPLPGPQKPTEAPVPPKMPPKVGTPAVVPTPIPPSSVQPPGKPGGVTPAPTVPNGSVKPGGGTAILPAPVKSPVPPVKPVKPPVVARPAPAPVKPPPSLVVDPDRSRDQAIGKAMNGRMVNANSLLEAAQKLGTSAGFEILWPTKKRHYGTYDMVDLIVNLGEWLLENVKGVVLSIGDVSAKNGGALGQYVTINGQQVWRGHASHRTGMDIDIAYLTRDRSKVMNRVDVPDKGGYTHSAFLAADQWRLMKMTHEVAPVEVIFVNRNIKNEMCKQALKAGDLKSNTDKTSPAAAILTKMVVQDKAHGNHWHVRLDCQMLKTMKYQTKCIPHPQLYVGPECKNIKL